MHPEKSFRNNNAVAYAEGMATVWRIVQREMERDIKGIAGKFGVEG